MKESKRSTYSLVETEQSAGADTTSASFAPHSPRSGLGRSVYAGVSVVIAVQACVIGWYAAHNWFYVDDFLFLRQAKDSGPTVSFLRLPLFEHFSPVHRIADWLLIRGVGPSWPVAAAVLVALTVACSLAFAYLVSSITRDSRIIISTTAFYALSLFFVRIAIWWTAGIHLMSVTLFSMLTLGGYARWHDRRSVPSLVLSVCSLALALLTHEDALLLIGFLVLLRLLVLTPHPRSLRDVYRAFSEDLWVWATYGLFTALAAWNFATWYWGQQPRPTIGELTRYMWMATGEGFFSTVFLVKIPEAMLHSPVLTGVLALGAGLLLVGFTIATRVGAWRPWLFFVMAFLATAVPLGLSRVRMFGVTLGRDPVYQMGPAYLFPFALAMAVGGPRRQESSAGFLTRLTARRSTRIALAGLAVVVFLGVYLRAASRTVGKGEWQATATRTYFTNLRADVSALSERGIRPEIFNPQVPPTIVPQWLAPFDRYAINLMVPSISSRTANASYLVTSSGRLRHVRVDEQYGGPIPSDAAAAAGWTSVGAGRCMAPRAGAGPVTLALPKPVEGADLVVRVDARLAKNVDATVVADDRATDITLTDGTAYAYVLGPSIAKVSISISQPSGCIERVAVARLVSANTP